MQGESRITSHLHHIATSDIVANGRMNLVTPVAKAYAVGKALHLAAYL